MDLSDKKILVVGLGKSGDGLLAFLDERALKISAFDSNEELKEIYCNKNYRNVEFYIGQNPTGNEDADLVVLSPGIPLDLKFIEEFRNRDIKIVGEVELAYNFAKGKFVSITGTNGKTTTTTLVGEFFKNANYDTRVVGNIGNPIISEVESSTENTIFVSELSSFQLETIEKFNSKTSTIINITPDHLNRHKTMENYAEIKSRIFKNQSNDDFAIINLDDKTSLELSEKILSKKIYTTIKGDKEAYRPLVTIEGEDIVLKNEKVNKIAPLSSILLKGSHNLENVLIAVAIAKSCDIDDKIIQKTLREFKGVEHRLEPVRTLRGVTFVNDSKGTNPDASIKAIEAINENILLIAGGFDKNSSFDEFVKLFDSRVKKVFLLGETKYKLAATLEKFHFKNYMLVSDMKEAVNSAFKEAQKGDTVLLSPACASWDMYPCYEERGKHFKKLVEELR